MNKLSLGSLSESSNIFDPELLKPIMAKLADKANSLPVDKRLDKLEKSLVAVDGSLLKALPKMLWALWVDKDHRAVKMHLELDIIKATPVRAELTDANANEAANLNANLTAGKLYVLDAGYRTYSLYENIVEAGSSVVARLQYNAGYEVIKENILSEDDLQAGIESDQIVWLGCQKKDRNDLSKPLRIIKINCPEKKTRNKHKLKSLSYNNDTSNAQSTQNTLLIVTDLMDLSAELIALIYIYRWQIEIFFRWFKCVLSAEHLLCHSQNGITIQ
ncbi:MAG: IS4 family transposase, partial [Candidatus Anammoxibacter sp.]